MISISNILPEDDPIAIADIGAALTGGEPPAYQNLVDAGRARLIAFEPDEAALTRLRERFPPPHLCLPHFVGDGKPAVFRATSWSPTGSLFRPNMPLLRKFNNLGELSQVVDEIPVQTVRLDDIAEIKDVDFIKIDAQGAEMMIFDNAERVLRDVTIIQTEVNMVEMYDGMPLFGDVDRTLRSQGFQWHTRLGCGYRAFLPLLNTDHIQGAFNQELWADVVYVRNWMHFDRVPPMKLLKLAVLLHDLYDSYDLAHLAMSAVDAQCGTNYAENYGKWMTEDESP